MDTYSFLRELADSWVLLAMFGFFLAVILWAFRPGSTATYDAVSRIPLRSDAQGPAGQGTQKHCANWANCGGCQKAKGLADV